MAEIVGWHYLHQNGDLLFKLEIGGTAADIRESPLALAMWPIDPGDREGAWNVLVEALASGANETRIQELAARWRCSDEDAATYADRVGARVFRDGDAWCATRCDFVDLQASPAAFGATALHALAALCKLLGFRPAKTWNARFKDLLAEKLPSGETSTEREHRDASSSEVTP